MDGNKEPRFGFTGQGVFLNHASVSPPTAAARRAVHEAADAVAADDQRFVHSKATSDQARAAFANFVRTEKQNVQCFQNTSAALSAVAWGLRWRPGDEVLVSRNEFVSNYQCWRMQEARGVQINHLQTQHEFVDPGILERQITDATAVVAVSAVHWATGARQDLRSLASICRDHDALLIVDAAQSLGATQHSIRADDYDVLATNTYKWMLSYNGTAFAEFSPRALDRLEESSFGWLAVDGDPEPTLVEDGVPKFRLGSGVERLLGGAPSVLSNVAAVAAMADLEDYGQARIQRQVTQNARKVMEIADAHGISVVTPRDKNRHAGLCALSIRNPEQAVAAFSARGIRLGSRGGLLRVAPHFYTTDDDLELFSDAMAQALVEAS